MGPLHLLINEMLVALNEMLVHLYVIRYYLNSTVGEKQIGIPIQSHLGRYAHPERLKIGIPIVLLGLTRRAQILQLFI